MKLGEITFPERTALFLDEGVPGETKAYVQQAEYNGQPHAFASRFSGRHGNRGNIAMAAGNVETLPISKVVQMDPAHRDAGRAVWPSPDVIWRTTPDEDPNLKFY